jgi:hypothetical protein
MRMQVRLVACSVELCFEALKKSAQNDKTLPRQLRRVFLLAFLEYLGSKQIFGDIWTSSKYFGLVQVSPKY